MSDGVVSRTRENVTVRRFCEVCLEARGAGRRRAEGKPVAAAVDAPPPSIRRHARQSRRRHRRGRCSFRTHNLHTAADEGSGGAGRALEKNESEFIMYAARGEREEEQVGGDETDFFSVPKCDTHLHLSAVYVAGLCASFATSTVSALSTRRRQGSAAPTASATSTTSSSHETCSATLGSSTRPSNRLVHRRSSRVQIRQLVRRCLPEARVAPTPSFNAYRGSQSKPQVEWVVHKVTHERLLWAITRVYQVWHKRRPPS